MWIFGSSNFGSVKCTYYRQTKNGENSITIVLINYCKLLFTILEFSNSICSTIYQKNQTREFCCRADVYYLPQWVLKNSYKDCKKSKRRGEYKIPMDTFEKKELIGKYSLVYGIYFELM